MFRNYEGYPDPTAGQALANIAKEEQRRRASADPNEMANPGAKSAGKNRRGNRRKTHPKTEVMRW